MFVIVTPLTVLSELFLIRYVGDCDAMHWMSSLSPYGCCLTRCVGNCDTIIEFQLGYVMKLPSYVGQDLVKKQLKL